MAAFGDIGPRTLMETLGHSQMSLTMDVYAHVLPGAKREAAALTDQLLTVNG